jgi:hypothetical protein
MKTPAAAVILILMSLTLFGSGTSAAASSQFTGYLELEGRYFFHDPLFPEQERHNASIALMPEYYHEWESGSSFVLVPFVRVDSVDPERTHFDIRELSYLWVDDTWELNAGFGKVFWGVTEFVHLVDIINQTDFVEGIDQEEKLGQPMIQLTFPRDWGVVEFFVLPYFRERTFPGPKGRLRPDPVVDTENPVYESSDGVHNTDLALRYSHTIGGWDMGVYYFTGTGRQPYLLPGTDGSGEPALIPFYGLIDQAGLDVQLVAGRWLCKLEALYQTNSVEDYYASTGGLEYTFVGVAGSDLNLGLIGEYTFDSRGDEAPTPYENDAMFGLRLDLNDPSGSALLAGIIMDTETSATIARLEASRRIGSNWTASLEAWSFSNIPPDDPAYSLRDDDYVRLELAYYF